MENINDILCKTKKKKSFPSFFQDEDNKIITDKTQIANKFNTFFATVGSKLASKINIPRNKCVHNYPRNTHNSTFNFKNINERTVDNIIHNLALKSSFDFDGLSTRLIKSIKILLKRPITIKFIKR